MRGSFIEVMARGRETLRFERTEAWRQAKVPNENDYACHTTPRMKGCSGIRLCVISHCGQKLQAL